MTVHAAPPAQTATVAAPVEFRRVGRTALLTVDNPPINALTIPVARALAKLLNQAQHDRQVDAIILRGAGRSFVAGEDLRRLDLAQLASLDDVPDLIARSVKPVVAAIHGYALGSGLSLAAGCHARVATADARLGAPDTLLGRIPAGGLLQRLPRLIGPRAALEMILSGRHIDGNEARSLGLVDGLAVSADAVLSDALELAAQMADRPPPWSRDDSQLVEGRRQPEMFDEMRAWSRRTRRGEPAPLAAVDCIEAAVRQDFATAREQEREALRQLLGGQEIQALHHAFRAERQAGRAVDVETDTPAPGIRRVCRISPGEDGFGDVAEACGAAGLHVSDGEQALGDADLVLLSHDIAAAPARRHWLDAAIRPGCLLVADPMMMVPGESDRSEEWPRAEAVATLGWLEVPARAPLLEIGRMQATSIVTAAGLVRLAGELGAVPVLCGARTGLLARRCWAALEIEAYALLMESATPAIIDDVMVEFGFLEGVFHRADRLRPVDAAAQARRLAALDGSSPSLPALELLERRTRWHEDPDALIMEIVALRERTGTARRAAGREEILLRLLLAAVNAGSRALDTQGARFPGDIDTVWIYGLGFPRHRGGLMYWADSFGTREISRILSAWEGNFGRRWRPDPLLYRLGRENRPFSALSPG